MIAAPVRSEQHYVRNADRSYGNNSVAGRYLMESTDRLIIVILNGSEEPEGVELLMTEAAEPFPHQILPRGLLRKTSSYLEACRTTARRSSRALSSC